MPLLAAARAAVVVGLGWVEVFGLGLMLVSMSIVAIYQARRLLRRLLGDGK